MSAKRKKKTGRVRRHNSSDAPAADEGFEDFERDCKQMVECLGRVKDPMLRYLICMLVDRLTRQIIAVASTGDVQRAHALKAIELN